MLMAHVYYYDKNCTFSFLETRLSKELIRGKAQVVSSSFGWQTKAAAYTYLRLKGGQPTL